MAMQSCQGPPRVLHNQPSLRWGLMLSWGSELSPGPGQSWPSAVLRAWSHRPQARSCSTPCGWVSGHRLLRGGRAMPQAMCATVHLASPQLPGVEGSAAVCEDRPRSRSPSDAWGGGCLVSAHYHLFLRSPHSSLGTGRGKGLGPSQGREFR